MIDRICRRLRHQQRDLERPPPRRGQRGQHIVEDILEQVAKPDVSETALGLGWTRREDAHTPLARMLDARRPERRLTDPCLTLEHERGPGLRLVDERMDRGEVALSADDFQHHPSRRIVTSSHKGKRRGDAYIPIA